MVDDAPGPCCRSLRGSTRDSTIISNDTRPLVTLQWWSSPALRTGRGDPSQTSSSQRLRSGGLRGGTWQCRVAHAIRWHSTIGTARGGHCRRYAPPTRFRRAGTESTERVRADTRALHAPISACPSGACGRGGWAPANTLTRNFCDEQPAASCECARYACAAASGRVRPRAWPLPPCDPTGSYIGYA